MNSTDTPTLYEILGVEPDATPEQIKYVYRKLASEHHPDREGGDEERMKDVQRAYDCLSDPEQRRVYDETGINESRGTIQSEALDVVTNLLEKAIEEVNSGLIDYVWSGLQEDIQQGEKAIQKIDVSINNFRRRLGKFKKKRAGQNLVDKLLEKKIVSKTAEIATIRRQRLVQEAALEILADYSEELGPMAGKAIPRAPGKPVYLTDATTPTPMP